MLTDTDIHYLVGILSLASSPDDVEIELGSRVYDEGGDKGRDVDITITVKNKDGTVTAYRGIEVKKHGRKLNIEHVEQLAIKLNDMPDITHKAIVSASGYTQGAIDKGKFHDVELLELVDWDSPSEGFEHFKATEMPFYQKNLNWVGSPHAHVNPEQQISNEVKKEFMENPNIYFLDGKENAEVPDFETLIKNQRTFVQNKIFEMKEIEELAKDVEKSVNITIDIEDNPYVIVSSGKIIINRIRFRGVVKWTESLKETQYKILKKQDDGKPIAGCAVAEIPSWGLCGLTVSDTEIRYFRVPVSDRNKKKILKQKLK